MSRDQEVLTSAPDAPDARVLALDVGVYGHRGSISSMFWYRAGGKLHTHVAELLPQDATLLDQLDVLEALAESYPEYWQVSPVVVVGVTVLSPIAKREVRSHLDSWFNPPVRRRLVSIGDYAGEQALVRGTVTRKKLRDLVAHRLTEHTITLTQGQMDAVSLYTGKREKPGRDPDTDEWRHDDTDAIAVPVALTCFATQLLLPPPLPTAEDLERQADRAARAWQLQFAMSDEEAQRRAWEQGHPRSVNAIDPTAGLVMRRPDPSVPSRGTRAWRTT